MSENEISSLNVVTNPYFATAACNRSYAGWTQEAVWGWSKKCKNLDPNPGSCCTALRWFYDRNPAGVLAAIYQDLVLPLAVLSLDVQCYYVSLMSGQGRVNILGLDGEGAWKLIATPISWGGHLKVWQQSPVVNVPVDTSAYSAFRLEMTGIHTGTGGLKMTGMSVVPVTPASAPNEFGYRVEFAHLVGEEEV
jgi:hypothetical protein